MPNPAQPTLLLLALALSGCGASLDLEVRARCRMLTGPTPSRPGADAPEPPGPALSQLATVRVRTTGGDRAEVRLGASCTLGARLDSAHGPPWRRARRFALDAGECLLEPFPGGPQRVTVFGPPVARDIAITDAPSHNPSYAFVDFNRDTDVTLHGMTQDHSSFALRCEYLAPR